MVDRHVTVRLVFSRKANDFQTSKTVLRWERGKACYCFSNVNSLQTLERKVSSSQLKEGSRLNITREHDHLLGAVKRWFDHPDRVAYYAEERTTGATEAERGLLQSLTEGGRVLDIGCGAGRISVFLA